MTDARLRALERQWHASGVLEDGLAYWRMHDRMHGVVSGVPSKLRSSFAKLRIPLANLGLQPIVYIDRFGAIRATPGVAVELCRGADGRYKVVPLTHVCH